MNPHVFLGTVTFLLWSVFSTWYYTCNIKGLCIENPDLKTVVQANLIEPEKPLAEIATDSLVTITLPPIDLLSNEIRFHKNTATVANPSEAKEYLNFIKNETVDREVVVTLVGHTCDLGTTDYNQMLGQKRAESFRDHLIQSGFNPATLTVSSKGETEPIVPNKDEAARARNRRIEITIKSANND